MAGAFSAPGDARLTLTKTLSANACCHDVGDGGDRLEPRTIDVRSLSELKTGPLSFFEAFLTEPIDTLPLRR